MFWLGRCVRLSFLWISTDVFGQDRASQICKAVSCPLPPAIREYLVRVQDFELIEVETVQRFINLEKADLPGAVPAERSFPDRLARSEQADTSSATRHQPFNLPVLRRSSSVTSSIAPAVRKSRRSSSRKKTVRGKTVVCLFPLSEGGVDLSEIAYPDFTPVGAELDGWDVDVVSG